MFQNDPNLIEKLVHSRQDEIMREIQDINRYKFLDSPVPATHRSRKFRAWVVVGLLTALIWLFNLII